MMEEKDTLALAVAKQLECPVCLLKFRIPKLLECMHTFCQDCLLHVSKHNRLGGFSIRCPTCRQKTKVVDITKLHNNYIVQSIIETMTLAEKKNTDKDSKLNSGMKALNIHNKDGGNDLCSSMDSLQISNGLIRDGEVIYHNSQRISNASSSTESQESSCFDQVAPNSVSEDITNSPDMEFCLIPSFNFGELDKTSFAPPVTTTASHKSGYNFSFCNLAPSIAFGASLEQTSFSALQINDTVRNNDVKTSPSDAKYFSETNFNMSCPSFSWGTLDKTSFH